MLQKHTDQGMSGLDQVPAALPMTDSSPTMDAMGEDGPEKQRCQGKEPSSKTRKRTYVEHDYQDHYFDPYYDVVQEEEQREEGSRRGPRGGVVEPFPGRLYMMLQQATRDGFEDIVSWQPHGRCFVVHVAQLFVTDIMPR